MILIRCGLRVGDAARLPFSCLVTDADGAPYLRYYNHFGVVEGIWTLIALRRWWSLGHPVPTG